MMDQLSKSLVLINKKLTFHCRPLLKTLNLKMLDFQYWYSNQKESDAPSIEKMYPIGSLVFFLGKQCYGKEAEIISHSEDAMNIQILVYCF